MNNPLIKDLLSTPLSISFSNVIQQTREGMKHYQINHVPRAKYTGVVVAAALSGVLYALSSSAAGERWDNAWNSGNFWLWAYGSGGAISNALFNAESYLTLFDYFDAQHAENEVRLIGPKNNRTQWILASIVGLFTLIPIFYQAFESTPSATLIGLTILSSLLNLPIYTDGGYSLGESIKALKISEQMVVYSESKKSPGAPSEDSMSHWRGKQKAFIANIECLIQHYSQCNQSERQELRNKLLEDQLSNSAFIAAINTSLPKSQAKKLSSKWTNGITCFMLAATVCSLWQNFGYTVVGGQAGEDTGKLMHLNETGLLSVGAFFGAMNLIPSLGFSVKGLVTINNTLHKLASKELSIAQSINPCLFSTVLAATLIFGLFSGGTSDQANYTSMCMATGEQVDCGSTGAWISGIIGNIGAGWFYNLPQCYLFVDRSFNLYYQHQGNEANQRDLAVINELAKLKTLSEAMPATKFKSIMNSNEFKACTESNENTLPPGLN